MPCVSCIPTIHLCRYSKYWWTLIGLGRMLVLAVVSTNLAYFGSDVSLAIQKE